MITNIVVSLTCILLAGLHFAFPNFEIDYITLVLLIVASLPWLAPLIKSLEIPGGFKIELQEVKRATDQVSEGSQKKEKAEAGTTSRKLSQLDDLALERLRNFAQTDPNMTLIGLRIEIEKRLAALAQSEGVDTRRKSVRSLLRELQQRNKLSPATASGLENLVALGNRAAHGADVTSDAAEWAIDAAPAILKMITPPHIAFLTLWDELDKIIITCSGLPLQSILNSEDF